MENPFPKIHWIYINLEHRKDRNEEIRKELLEFIPEENIHRIDAIKHDYGALGCSLSHIKALEYAKQFDISCILEDDFVWMNKERVWNILNRLLIIDFNVFLGSGFCDRIITKNGFFYNVTNSGSTSCYIIKKKYIDTLQNNFKESAALLNLSKKKEYILDNYWKKLQPFLTTNPCISKQRITYSDIEKKVPTYMQRIMS